MRVLAEQAFHRSQQCARPNLLKPIAKGKAPYASLLDVVELLAKLNTRRVSLPLTENHNPSFETKAEREEKKLHNQRTCATAQLTKVIILFFQRPLRLNSKYFALVTLRVAAHW